VSTPLDALNHMKFGGYLLDCDAKPQTRIRSYAWKLVLSLLITAFLSSCYSMKHIDCEISPQTKNGWVASSYHPPYRTPRPINISQYRSPAISATMEAHCGCYDLLTGPPFIPIFSHSAVRNSNECTYKLVLVLDNKDDKMEVDLRGLRIILPNGKTEKYSTAFYCETPIKEYGDCLGPNKQDASLAPVVLSKGTYAFQLIFPGVLDDGTSSVDFTEVFFWGKKNQVPILPISKKTVTSYCPLGEHFGCN
jgi:hypothetical protein